VLVSFVGMETNSFPTTLHWVKNQYPQTI